MTPAEIPRPQSQRVALYEQRFGRFDSGKNAYWSLRKGRPVTLAEGARFDVAMKAGRLAPVVVGRLAPVVMMTTMRLGWWRNTITGEVRQGTRTKLPSRMAGWRWSSRPSESDMVIGVRPRMPASPPQERFLHMPTEAKRIDALPSTPPPGPARPPSEPLFDAIMRQLREKQAGPATSITTTRPAFAAPARSLTPGTTPLAAGFDMKKLALPLALVAGAFVVSKLV